MKKAADPIARGLPIWLQTPWVVTYAFMASMTDALAIRSLQGTTGDLSAEFVARMILIVPLSLLLLEVRRVLSRHWPPVPAPPP